jgi:tetrahydromethanopterin S-methyltransferase subunit G
MFDDYKAQTKLLVELEERHDDLLRRLDDLDKRVEKVLGEWSPRREPASQSA